MVVSEHRQGKGFVVRSMFRDIEADCYIMVDGTTHILRSKRWAVTLCAVREADMVIGDRLSSTYFEENKRYFHAAGNRLVRFLSTGSSRSEVQDIMTGFTYSAGGS